MGITDKIYHFHPDELAIPFPAYSWLERTCPKEMGKEEAPKPSVQVVGGCSGEKMQKRVQYPDPPGVSTWVVYRLQLDGQKTDGQGEERSLEMFDWPRSSSLLL